MTNAKPNYEVVRIEAVFNCYDAIVGWTARRVAVAHTKAWARHLAGKVSADYDVYAKVREIDNA